MMKKFTAISIVVFLAFFSFTVCKKKPSTPVAGKATPDDILNLVPSDVQGVFFVDFQRAMTSEIVNEVMQEEKTQEKLQEFITKTGIDPQKDVFFIAGALTEGMGEATQKGVAIINLRYDKHSLLPMIKEKMEEEEQVLSEEEYSGFTVYHSAKENDEGSFSFLDDSNIVLGQSDSVKAVIDVLQKKGDNVFKNKKLSDVLNKTDKKALFWGAFLFPPELMDKAASQNPMLGNLKAITASTLSFDYKDKNIIGEIKVMSSEQDKIQQIADMLNGLKAFGGMAAAKNPEVGELMESIEISTGEDHVRIYASVPEELISKLKTKVTPPSPPEQEE